MKKKVLITGGTRGIGKALVDIFHQKGWEVFTCGRGNKKPATSHADHYLTCDVSDKDQVREMFSQIEKVTQELHMVVNNAGIAGSNTLENDNASEEWDRILKTNLHGTFYVTQNSLTLLKSGAKIINIASVLGHTGVSDQTAYCASKHGIIGFTKSLAKKLAPRGISVNAVSPGWTQTDMAEGRASEIGKPLQRLASLTPMGHIIAPEEIAYFCWQLSDETVRSMTGQSLIIDCGFFS